MTQPQNIYFFPLFPKTEGGKRSLEGKQCPAPSAHLPTFQLVTLGLGRLGEVPCNSRAWLQQTKYIEEFCCPSSRSAKTLLSGWFNRKALLGASLTETDVGLEKQIGRPGEGDCTCCGLAGNSHSQRWEKVMKKKSGLWKWWNVQSGWEIG